MPRIKPSPQLIEDIVACVPEGFINLQTVAERLKIHNKARNNINKANAALQKALRQVKAAS